MNPFSVVSNLSSIPSAFLHRRTSSSAVNVVVQTSPSTTTLKNATLNPPHALTTTITEEEVPHVVNVNDSSTSLSVSKPRNNPQAILPDFDNRSATVRHFSIGVSDDSDDDNSTDDASLDSVCRKPNRHSIHTMPLPTSTKEGLHRAPLWRQHSLPTVHSAIEPTNSAAPSTRASFDSLSRAMVLKPSPEDTVQATTMISHPLASHLRHTRSASLPTVERSSPSIRPSHTPLPAPSQATFPNIPSAKCSTDEMDPDQDDEEEEEDIEVGSEKEEDRDDVMFPLPQTITSKTSPADTVNDVAVTPSLSSRGVPVSAPQLILASPPPSPALQATSTRRDSVSHIVVATPTPVHKENSACTLASPTLKTTPDTAASLSLASPPPSPPAAPVTTSIPTSTSSSSSSDFPSPPSARASAASFLSSWQGRSRAMIPNIPRPSPLMPFRAARSVVHSVTSVGTGLIPSKEQLGSIPVAGRILNHPVMDSTLSYIATKASERGISLSVLTGGIDSRKLIAPEDVPYRKLNKKLIHQAMTLSVLAVQQEELSKTIDDDAGDDAFELYLAAINTLLHALPCELFLYIYHILDMNLHYSHPKTKRLLPFILVVWVHHCIVETCDPLRREAFETQLRDFLDDQLDRYSADGYLSDSGNSKRLRRRRRRRHRQHYNQSTAVIQQHTSVVPDLQLQKQKRAQRVQQRNQRKELIKIQQQQQQQQQKQKQQQATLKQQKKKQEEEEKAVLDRKHSKHVSSSTPSMLSSASLLTSSLSHASKITKRTSRSRRHHRAHNHHHDHVDHQDLVNNDNPGGLGDTIISTAVHSAIRLKQSPIPDVVKSCLRTSRNIFNKVDERFHLQDKAWELSKQSIEKAIELDEQYAIHEVVTETVFATLTGLVKAGIAYKETPSYSSVRAAAAAEAEAEVSSRQRSHNPQEVLVNKKQTGKNKKQESESMIKLDKSTRVKDLVSKHKNVKSSMAEVNKGKRNAIVESDEGSDLEDDLEDSESDSDASEAEKSSLRHSSSSSSSRSSASSSASSVYVESDDDSEDEEEPIELNRKTLRSTSSFREGYGSDTNRLPPPPPYSEQMREKIDMFMALKGAASLFVGSL
ncbi:hypothetical protein BGX28_002897 [Mortierella sp. GBA30]|nr:hypothetical protein BGX28_002897 [Mortierella sp. GBA30]